MLCNFQHVKPQSVSFHDQNGRKIEHVWFIYLLKCFLFRLSQSLTFTATHTGFLFAVVVFLSVAVDSLVFISSCNVYFVQGVNHSFAIDRYYIWYQKNQLIESNRNIKKHAQQFYMRQWSVSSTIFEFNSILISKTSVIAK